MVWAIISYTKEFHIYTLMLRSKYWFAFSLFMINKTIDVRSNLESFISIFDLDISQLNEIKKMENYLIGKIFG